MANKELQKILKDLITSREEIKEMGKSGAADLSKVMSSLRAIPEMIEKNMDKFPKEQQELFKSILKEAKEKTSEEYIYKEAFKKYADKNN